MPPSRNGIKHGPWQASGGNPSTIHHQRFGPQFLIAPFPNRPGGKLYPGYHRGLILREPQGVGYEVIRCFSTFSSESTTASRFLENISFGITSGLTAFLIGKPDVIYANSWPIFATGILCIVACLRRVPLVISVQDIYPESLISQQHIRADSWLARFLKRIDAAIACRSAAVIVISPSFAALYRDKRAVSSERIKIIPNWIDSATITPNDPHGVTVRANLNLSTGMRLGVYGGNIGMAAGVETLIESIRYFENENSFHLLVAGEGSQLSACQNRAQQLSPNRVTFHTPWPKDETSSVLSAADFLILPTRGQQSLASVPSKLITYMLSAKPVLALAWPDSDLANIIGQSGCGWVVEPDRPDLLAAQIRCVLAIDASELSRRGMAGRQYALANFSKEVCLPKVIDILERVAVQLDDN